jgi:dihydropteroate synthase
MQPLVLTIKKEIREWKQPLVMAILNATPDSFYAGSRSVLEKQVHERIEAIAEQGADILDIGGMSSRPGADMIDIEEEWQRIEPALNYASKHYSQLAVSVDTFRSEIALRAFRNYGIDLVNDISGGQLDSEMIKTVGEFGIGYIGMHMRGNPSNMQQLTQYDNLMFDLTCYFGALDQQCKQAGIASFIIDPGIGFSKTLDQNYEILNKLEMLDSLGLPILIGVSRKSLIYKFLEIEPEESLIGTTVLNTLAILKGARILRVHDVKETVETIKLVQKTLNAK